ncbi:YcnI family protein [Geodermatophilus sp. DSM 44513]|uniref:YcnI family protein n=1 Tax=Geodermatophilus sp. DSM 44513 TaxID=1528104 RepID=UPI00128130B6|nr:YcnI family protein [Geodermatophilus sp. DSM 44513]WNV76692.1 YcnI family protein [Geodermatophilus sp. DSM 44513]
MSSPLPRPLARLGVVALALLTALAAALAGASAAAAHVTVSSDDAAAGGYGKLVFRVPNESDTASTVALRISVPPDAAMASLRTQPVPGWTVTTTTADLPAPREAHGEPITGYVSVVEFRAVDGGGIRPGEFQEFALSGGPFPDADRLTFPAVQTYSDGTEAAWIEPTVAGQAEPARPAPLLTLTAAADAGHGTAGTSTTGTDTTATDTAAAAGAAEHGEAGPGALALFVALLALLTGLAGVVLGWRAGRRTVSS